MAEDPQAPNCPFYGRHLLLVGRLYEPELRLLNSHGNQCALIRKAFSPCRMEVRGETPDWRRCEIVEQIRP